MMGGSLRRRAAGLIGIVIVTAITAWAVRSDFGHSVEEHTGLNLLFQLRGNLKTPSKVFIIDVGKPAFDKNSQLPQNGPCAIEDGNVNSDILSRCELAKLINTLAQYKPAVIAIDIAFEKHTNADEILVKAIRDAGNVIILKRAHSVLDPATGLLREQLLPLQPDIQSASLGAAPFPVPKRPDQLTRYWTFHRPFGNHPTLPTLTYYAWAKHHAAESANVPAQSGHVPLEIELAQLCQNQASGKLRNSQIMKLLPAQFCEPRSKIINFYGGPGTIPILDSTAIAADRAGELKGSAVFLGLVSRYTYQQQDAFRTVFSDARGFDLSGVEIAATAFLNTRDHTGLLPLPGVQWLIAVAFVFLTYIGCLLFSKTSARLLYLLVLTIFLTGGAALAFSWLRLWIPLFIPAAISLTALVLFSLYDNERLKQRLSVLRTAVNNYIFPWQEGEYLKNLSPGKHHRAVYGLCIKFDFEDYSILASRISTEELTTTMNANFDWAIGEISRSGGQIVSPGDDSFLAYWELKSQSAQPLTLYALSCAAKISEGNPVYADGDPHKLKLRAGVSMGSFALGNVGGHGRYAVNLTGQIVNQAARIEQMNRALGTRMLCSEAVAKLIPDERCRYVGTFPLKGHPQPSRLYEIHVEDGDQAVTRIAPRGDFKNALDAYEAGASSIAKAAFEKLHDDFPDDGPVTFYCELLESSGQTKESSKKRLSGEVAP